MTRPQRIPERDLLIGRDGFAIGGAADDPAVTVDDDDAPDDDVVDEHGHDDEGRA